MHNYAIFIGLFLWFTIQYQKGTYSKKILYGYIYGHSSALKLELKHSLLCVPLKFYLIHSKKRNDYLEWPDYFMAIAFLSAQRSKDPRTQVIYTVFIFTIKSDFFYVLKVRQIYCIYDEQVNLLESSISLSFTLTHTNTFSITYLNQNLHHLLFFWVKITFTIIYQLYMWSFPSTTMYQNQSLFLVQS